MGSPSEPATLREEEIPFLKRGLGSSINSYKGLFDSRKTQPFVSGLSK
jgi:hypothetical protein